MRASLSFLCLISAVGIGRAQQPLELKTQVAKAITELRDFVSLPNDALNPDDIDANLMWLRNKFSDRGFNTSILETENLPLFFASLPMDDTKPTILFYMHLDGQSVDPSQWDQKNPYETVLKSKEGDGWKEESFDLLNDDIDYEWRLFGRSTSDDKGPIVMFLNAYDLLKKNNVTLPFNIKVILDSEEERSSAPLPKAVKTYRELLQAN